MTIFSIAVTFFPAVFVNDEEEAYNWRMGEGRP
jgi:hypothetical protein